MIHNTNQINEQELKDLEQLRSICKKEDGSTPNLYTHILTQPRVFPATLLYYEEARLIGFLSVYFFYDAAVEITLMVHPSARKQGIATQLIKAVLPLIQSQNMHTLIFSSPEHINDKWLKIKKFNYLHSEYYMERNDLSPILNGNSAMSFRTATIDDIPVLCALDDVCFNKNPLEVSNRFQHLFDNREYQVIIALYNNNIIGKAHIRWQERGATLSDIAILPAEQGKGLGTALIAHCINYALSEGKPLLNLDVETHNHRALNLYTRLGFCSQNACDYWAIDIKYLLKN